MGADVRLERRHELVTNWTTIVDRIGVLPRVLEVPPGRRVMSQAQSADSVYCLETGVIKLLHRQAEGTEIVVGLIDDGCPFGTGDFALGRPNSTSAVAVTDARLTAIPAMPIRRVLPHDLLLSDALLRINSLQLLDQLDHFALLAVQPARRRVESFLRQLLARRRPESASGDLRLDLPCAQCELASIVHLTPETVSRAMVDLEREGVIRRSTSRTLYLRATPTGRLDRDHRVA